LDNGKMIKLMVRAYLVFQMVIHIKGISMRDKEIVRGYIFITMAINIKDNGMRIKKKELGY